MSDERPLGSYAALALAFGSALGAFVVAEGKRLPREPSWSDTVLIGIASHKLGRLIAKEDVTSFLRAPVTVDEEASRPEPHGFRRAAGQLLTCPSCVGLWVAAGFSGANVLWPSHTRFVASVLAAHSCADFLNAGFVRIKGS